ncbi:MAG: lipoyl(octanoyl) transferase LipB [Desulfatiglandales bacterium]
MQSFRKEWYLVDLGLTDYRTAWALQLRLVEAKREDVLKADVVLLGEHPAVFTLGRRGGLSNLKVSQDFLAGRGIEVLHVERGGDITFHGPGQLVMYPVVGLRTLGLGVLSFVEKLEEIMIRSLADWGIKGNRNSMNRGAWVDEGKIGSVGIAVRRAVSFHGLALNVNTDLEPFTWVNPCGLHQVSITSMKQMLGKGVPMQEVKEAATRHTGDVFAIQSATVSIQELEGELGLPTYRPFSANMT